MSDLGTALDVLQRARIARLLAERLEDQIESLAEPYDGGTAPHFAYEAVFRDAPVPEDLAADWAARSATITDAFVDGIRDTARLLAQTAEAMGQPPLDERAAFEAIHHAVRQKIEEHRAR